MRLRRCKRCKRLPRWFVPLQALWSCLLRAVHSARPTRSPGRAGTADGEAVCRATVTLASMAVGVFLPTLVAALTWRPQSSEAERAAQRRALPPLARRVAAAFAAGDRLLQGLVASRPGVGGWVRPALATWYFVATAWQAARLSARLL